MIFVKKTCNSDHTYRSDIVSSFCVDNDKLNFNQYRNFKSILIINVIEFQRSYYVSKCKGQGFIMLESIKLVWKRN